MTEYGPYGLMEVDVRNHRYMKSLLEFMCIIRNWTCCPFPPLFDDLAIYMYLSCNLPQCLMLCRQGPQGQVNILLFSMAFKLNLDVMLRHDAIYSTIL